MKVGAHRAVGASAFVVAIAVALATRGFVVGFISDPIGPRALPWLAAALLASGGVSLALGRPVAVTWPARPVLRRLGAAVAVLAGFAVLAEPMGFIVAAAFLGTAFGRLFGAGWRSALVVGGGLSLALYAFFAWALGVALPVGAWFGGG